MRGGDGVHKLVVFLFQSNAAVHVLPYPFPEVFPYLVSLVIDDLGQLRIDDKLAVTREKLKEIDLGIDDKKRNAQSP